MTMIGKTIVQRWRVRTRGWMEDLKRTLSRVTRPRSNVSSRPFIRCLFGKDKPPNRSLERMEKTEHVEYLVLIAWFVSSRNFHMLQTAENNLDSVFICHTCRRELPRAAMTLAASLKILETALDVLWNNKKSARASSHPTPPSVSWRRGRWGRFQPPPCQLDTSRRHPFPNTESPLWTVNHHRNTETRTIQ